MSIHTLHDLCYAYAVADPVREMLFALQDRITELEAQRKPLTEREVELIDGMIEVQRDHAKRCDNIANRTMADKQKGWDMERVELLLKMKAAHTIKEGT